jgi:CBS domain-containing protein
MAMKVADAMSYGVITVAPECLMTTAAEMMLKFDISGLPVVSRGKLVGIITEGDFLRRLELGTEDQPRLRLSDPTEIGPLAEAYAHSHGRKVEEVMTRDVVTATEDTALDDVIKLMAKHNIKRVPVLRNGVLVGMVSRSNILHAFIVLSSKPASESVSDAEIRQRIETELENCSWALQTPVGVQVKDGVVDLSGIIGDPRQRVALRIAAENVLGVKIVRDRLILRQGPAS